MPHCQATASSSQPFLSVHPFVLPRALTDLLFMYAIGAWSEAFSCYTKDMRRKAFC